MIRKFLTLFLLFLSNSLVLWAALKGIEVLGFSNEVSFFVRFLVLLVWVPCFFRQITFKYKWVRKGAHME